MLWRLGFNPNDRTLVIQNHLEYSTNILRQALPDCQPQEGSPANTFTDAEKQKLQPFLNNLKVNGSGTEKSLHNQMDILEPWTAIRETSSEFRLPDEQDEPLNQSATLSSSSETSTSSLRETSVAPALDWYGAPRFATPNIHLPRAFRQKVRRGLFQGPTNAVCPGFLQCNLVILPQGPHAFDFLLFCQRNPKACPLIEVVCDSPHPVGVALDADLRTDVPKYAIYRNGVLEREATDITNEWPERAVAFLIGCSFSYDGALMEAGIPLRSAEAGKNVPMYRTNLKCRPAGSLSGNIVVSMKPIPALQIAKHAEITTRFPHAHGGPLCIGRPDVIGVPDLNKPDWGEAIDLGPDEVPVFHACGVTPQAVLMESKVPFAITHAAGHMFVTDLPSDMNV